MASYNFEYAQKLVFKKGVGVVSKVSIPAVRIDGKLFSIGKTIGFQYKDTTFVGKLVKIDFDNHLIYVEIKLDGHYGIYGFSLNHIDKVYGK